MKRVSLTEFKGNCSALLSRVQKTKKPLLTTRFGKPVAEIVPVPPMPKSDWIGSMKDTIEIVGDIVVPAGDEGDWEVLRD